MELIYHLMDQYMKTTPINIKDNNYWMEESIDTYQPINIYLKRIDSAVQLSSESKTPCTDKQILHKLYLKTLTTGL